MSELLQVRGPELKASSALYELQCGGSPAASGPYKQHDGEKHKSTPKTRLGRAASGTCQGARPNAI